MYRIMKRFDGIVMVGIRVRKPRLITKRQITLIICKKIVEAITKSLAVTVHCICYHVALGCCICIVQCSRVAHGRLILVELVDLSVFQYFV